MRMVIKNADFSSVSIGKVYKDLSFSYDTDAKLREIPWLNVVDTTADFPWTENNNASNTLILVANSSSSSYSTMTDKTRFVTDYIEVVQGMTITGKFANTNTVPTIVCFDENKNTLGPSSTYCSWINGTASFTFTVPAGVKYIKLQCSSIYASSGYKFVGTMPSA